MREKGGLGMRNEINDIFLKSVGRHFVTMSCMQTIPKTNAEHVALFSGFVIAVDEVWFYVTAGHILRKIQSSIAAGVKHDVWRFGDQTARGPFNDIAIPFDFVADQWVVIENDAVGLDYAALPLRDFYRQALEGGGILPLRKDSWGDHVTEYDQWVLVGIPGETVTHNGKSLITAKVVSVALKETEAPEGAGARSDNQFYGRLIEGSEAVVRNVEGMSGGPIFSTKKIDNALKYKVIGVQSAWYRSSRVIAACPFSSLGLCLENAVQLAEGESKE